MFHSLLIGFWEVYCFIYIPFTYLPVMFLFLSYSVVFQSLPSLNSPSYFPAFQGYNHVTEEEMKGMKWLEEKAEDSAPMDTYMDTCEQSKNKNTRNSLKSWWASRDLNPGPDDYESYQSTYIDYYYLLLIIIIYSIINIL